MNRTDTFVIELNKPETRFLHNACREWVDNHIDTASDLEMEIADELCKVFYNAWKEKLNDIH